MLKLSVIIEAIWLKDLQLNVCFLGTPFEVDCVLSELALHFTCVQCGDFSTYKVVFCLLCC